MAQLLISNVNQPNRNGVETFSLHDVVTIKANGERWGSDESIDEWIARYGSAGALNEYGQPFPNIGRIITIADMTVEQAKSYLIPEFRDAVDGDLEFLEPEPEARKVLVRLRAYKFDDTQIPAARRTELNRDGRATSDKNECRNAIVHKTTNARPIDDELRGR